MKARIAKILRHPAAQRGAAIMFSEVMERDRHKAVNPARAAKRRLRAMDHRTRGRIHARLRKLGEKLYPRPPRWKHLSLPLHMGDPPQSGHRFIFDDVTSPTWQPPTRK